MDKKDIMELKRRLKKDEVTFSRMCGCYVDGEHNKVLKINEQFLNLDEDLFFKYLEIAKKVLSGKAGDSMLTLDFPIEEENAGGRQQFLMGLKESELKNEDMLDIFYDRIIEHYEYAGNYIILIYHDCYDVMMKTSDNRKMDESEEVYEYLLCAICPVKLSKPGLGYLSEENKIGVRIRDWVVNPPETGFVFPAFTDRSSDIHALGFYTKNTKEPHYELAEKVLGCSTKKTATIKRNIFEAAVCDTFKTEDSGIPDIYLDIQEEIKSKVEIDDDAESVQAPDVISIEDIGEIIESVGVPEDEVKTITQQLKEEYADETPKLEEIFDKRILEKNNNAKEIKELKKEICTLRENNAATASDIDAEEKFDINIITGESVSIEPKVCEIDGKKCLVVPLDGAENILIDGENIN